MSPNEKNASKPRVNEVDSLYNTTTEVASDTLRSILGINADFSIRMLLIRNNPKLPVTLAYIDGMVDSNLINDSILKPLAQDMHFASCKTETDAVALISTGIIYSSSIKVRSNMKDLTDDILEGHTAIIFNNAKIAFTFEAKSALSRAISEPTGENAIKGAKDSFIENVRTNTALCRKKLASPYLCLEEFIVGKQTKTVIAMLYLKNITNEKLVNEVRKRLEAIDIDSVFSPGTIEEYIVDNKYSSFPQILYTERPDKFCANISDGRVGIIIDGLPITYIIPGTLLQFMQTQDDYSYQFIVGSTLRFLRFITMLITLVLPGFYITITTFHPEMLPSELAFSIVAAKEGVPFPMFVEVLILLIAFEILLEAGLRMPKAVGQTVSIVGALVVGQAAVEAKLVSPATVIVVAITVIAGFTMPTQDFSNALRLWRFFFVILSSYMGMFGLTFGLIILLHHWCSLESFGVPYLDPFVANEDEQLQDTIFRFPTATMKNRPSSLNPKNKKRME